MHLCIAMFMLSAKSCKQVLLTTPHHDAPFKNLATKPAKEQIEKKKEKVPSPTGIMQSRTTKRRSVSRSPRVKDQKTLSR